MPEAMISLPALFELDDALSPFVDTDARIGALRAVLRWAEAQGFLWPRPEAVRIVGISPVLSSAVFPPPSGDDLAEAPKGGEGVSPPDEAPATPVAGGVAPLPVQKPGLAPLWSEEEDEKAIALKLSGHTAHEIAQVLGRPEAGTTSRLSKTLKARIDAARQAGAGSVKPPAPEPDQPAEAQPDDGGPLHVVEGPMVAAAILEQVPAATVTIPASAPAFDPSQPGWWRTANANLSALGYRRPFNAQGDLQLVEDLLKGMKLDMVAADMLISAVDLRNRWRALLSAVGTPEGKLPNIEEQRHLLEILRARAAEKSLKAAE